MAKRNDEPTWIFRTDVGNNLLRPGGIALLVGILVGLVGAWFRLALLQADEFRNDLIAWAHGFGVLGLFFIVLGCAVMTTIAAWLVRRFAPHASGSGIPHVEAVLRQEMPPAPVQLIPVKFIGGVLAIGSGLALGREGPSVQMGASLAHLLGKLFRCSSADCLTLMASGAGAGLATAFNAPIAGAVFVLEELVRRFDTRITITTFGASAGAIGVSRLFLGNPPDFHVPMESYSKLIQEPYYLLLGTLAGFVGIAYNRTILGGLALTERFPRWTLELRAAAIGASVGLIAWFAPGLVGGGDVLTQRTLAGNETVLWLAGVFLLRFALGPLCYAARTPGGLFAPMLVLGVQGGLLYGLLCRDCFGDLAPDPQAMAVVGMAAFFTAVVRSPLTGIVLAIELTGCFTLLLPMLTACFAAMLLPTLFSDRPIYEALRESP